MTGVKLILVFAVFLVSATSLLTEAAAIHRQVISDNIPVQVVYDEKQEKAYQKTLEGESRPFLEDKISNEVETPKKVQVIFSNVDLEIKADNVVVEQKPLTEKIVPYVEIIQAIPIKLDVIQEEAVKNAVPSPEVVKVVEDVILPEIIKVEDTVVPNIEVVDAFLDGEENKQIPKIYQLKNNEEIVQLNSEELLETAKYSAVNDVVKTKIVTPDVETVTVNNGNRSPSYHQLSEEYYNRVQQVVQNGINEIKADVKAYETKSGQQVTPEILEQLEATASEYLRFVRSKVDLKAVTLNHQEIVDTFKTNSEAFLKNVQIIGKQDAGVTPAPTPPDNQNGFQNFINIISNGFQSISNNLGGGQSQAGQGDEGATSQNPFQSFVASFSNFFGGGGQHTGTQGDEASGTTPPNIIFQAINNLQTGFSNLIGQGSNNAGSSTPSTPIQGDETPVPVAPAPPPNPLVQAFNSIQTGISNFGANLVGQGTPAPAVPADEGVTPTPSNPFSQVITSIQSGISSFGSNLGIGQPATTGNPPAQGDEQPVTPNGFQQFINNVGTGFSQILPFGQQQQPQQQSTGNTQSDTVTPTPANPAAPALPSIPGIPQNPQVQGIVNQVSQSVQGGPGAIGEQAQNALGQVSQQFGGFNPVNVQGGPAGGSVQNIINQASSGFNIQPPAMPTSTTVGQGDEVSAASTAINPINSITPPSNVASQLQNIGSQAGQTLGGIFGGNTGNIQNLNPSEGLQNIQNVFGQVVSQGASAGTLPSASPSTSTAQDESAATSSTTVIPNIPGIGNIANFVGPGSQLFGQGSNVAQSVASQIGAVSSSGGSANQVQSVVQNFVSQGQSQITNLGPTTAATVATLAQGDEATANPLPFASQIPQLTGDAQLPTIPGIGSNNSPIQQLQGVILQGSQNAGNIIQGSNNPQQLFESASSQLNPTNQIGGSSTGGIQQAVQTVQSQVVSQINQGNEQQSIFSPQGIQTAVSQAAGAITPASDEAVTPQRPLQALAETVANLNPFRRRSTQKPAIGNRNKDMTLEAKDNVVSNLGVNEKEGVVGDFLQSITNFLSNSFGGNKPVLTSNPVPSVTFEINQQEHTVNTKLH